MASQRPAAPDGRPDIVVEISDAPSEAGQQWRDLAGRAAPNVFVNPAMTDAARAAGFEDTLELTAWDRSVEPARLVGVWAFCLQGLTPLGPAVLTAPVNDYCFLSNPVVDAAYIGTVMPAFLDAIARNPALPKVIRLRYLDAGAETYTALVEALAARGARQMIVSQRERAFALPEANVKRAGATRKKLRQDWNRLAREDTVTVVNGRDPATVVAAFETFLALEAAGWKTGSGTAVLSDARNTQFARTMIAALASEGNASVMLLMVGERAIAAQVLLYCGRRAFTWKTGFDPAYGRYSPGAILIDAVASELLSGAVDSVDSCSHHGGFMRGLWIGRRKTVDLLVDLDPARPWKFRFTALKTLGRQRARRLRDRARKLWNGGRKGSSPLKPIGDR